MYHNEHEHEKKNTLKLLFYLFMLNILRKILHYLNN